MDEWQDYKLDGVKKQNYVIIFILVLIALLVLYNMKEDSNYKEGKMIYYKTPMASKYKPKVYNMLYRPHHFVNRERLADYKINGN